MAGGRIIEGGADKLVFDGTFSGTLFAQYGVGDFDGANFSCASKQEFDMAKATTKAEGRCTIESVSGQNVFAKFKCAGVPGACKGTFELKGGTGMYEKITGKGNFNSRKAIADLIKQPNRSIIIAHATGISMWSALTYKLNK
jgi:hypothetical protein